MRGSSLLDADATLTLPAIGLGLDVASFDLPTGRPVGGTTATGGSAMRRGSATVESGEPAAVGEGGRHIPVDRSRSPANSVLNDLWQSGYEATTDATPGATRDLQVMEDFAKKRDELRAREAIGDLRADLAVAGLGRDFARRYVETGSYISAPLAAIQAGVYMHDGNDMAALAEVGGLAKLRAGLSIGKMAIGAAESGLNIVYRGITEADAVALRSGGGLTAKAPNGTWTASEHVANTGPGTGGAAVNSPWISTSRRLDVATAYDSGNGVVAIDLNKVNSLQVEVWRTAPRVNGVEGLPYHRSIWSQEVTIHGTVPREAIIWPR